MSTRNQRTNFFLGFQYHFYIYTQVGIGQPFFPQGGSLSINLLINIQCVCLLITDVEICAIPLDKHDFLINIFEILFLFQNGTYCIQFKNRGGRGFIGDGASLLQYPFPCPFIHSKHLSSLTIDCSSTNDFIIRSKSTSVKRVLANNKIINHWDLLASLIITILKY